MQKGDRNRVLLFMQIHIFVCELILQRTKVRDCKDSLVRGWKAKVNEAGSEESE